MYTTMFDNACDSHNTGGITKIHKEAKKYKTILFTLRHYIQTDVDEFGYWDCSNMSYNITTENGVSCIYGYVEWTELKSMDEMMELNNRIEWYECSIVSNKHNVNNTTVELYTCDTVVETDFETYSDVNMDKVVVSNVITESKAHIATSICPKVAECNTTTSITIDTLMTTSTCSKVERYNTKTPIDIPDTSSNITKYLFKCIDKIDSFDDVYNIVIDMTEKQKGDLFEEITKYVFLYDPRINNDVKSIWLYDDLPTHLKTDLNIPIRDEGIDLVMLSKNDQWYSIQCKFRTDVNQVISWKELSTFCGLTYGVANGFHKAILVTNTDTITKNLATNPGKYDILNGDFFSKITQETWYRIRTILLNVPSDETHIPTPYAHQLTIIDKTLDYLNEHSRGYLKMACGSGKTLTSYWIDKNMNNMLTIIVVPSLYLLSQFYDEWCYQTHYEDEKIRYILVGSDVDCKNGDHQNLFLKMDKDDVIDMLVDKDIKNIIITTYNSAYRIKDILNELSILVDLCIFDEAHCTAGLKDKFCSILLNDVNLLIKKRLFMTATPKIYAESNDNENVLSMDNKSLYGDCIYRYNTNNAIADDFLCNYKFVTMYTNDDFIKEYIEKNTYIHFNQEKENESHYVAAAILILNAFNNNECHHLFTYHHSVKKSKKFRDLLSQIAKNYDMDDLTILQMDGFESMKTRKNDMKRFETSYRSILCSSKVLGVGINVPIVDSVCFIDARSSKIDVNQCVGRALRKHERKTIAKVLIPVITNDLDTLDKSTFFGNIIELVEKMAMTDDDILTYFTHIQEGKKSNRELFEHTFHFSIEEMIRSKEINIEEWIKSIEIKVWKSVNQFEYMKGLLFEFADLYCKTPVNIAMYKGENLGNWYDHRKKFINNSEHEMYKILSVNKFVKKNLEKMFTTQKRNKEKPIMTEEEIIALIIRATVSKNAALSTVELFKNIDVGDLYSNRKYKIVDSNDDMYKKFAGNKIITDDIDQFFKDRENRKTVVKLTQEQKYKEFMDYIEKEKDIPPSSVKFSNGKSLRKWYDCKKCKIVDEDSKQYIDLAKNSIIKAKLDTFIKKKIENTTKVKLSEDKKMEEFNSFMTDKNKIQLQDVKFSDDLGMKGWYERQRKNITNNNDSIYTMLSVNKVVKENLDKYLSTRDI